MYVKREEVFGELSAAEANRLCPFLIGQERRDRSGAIQRVSRLVEQDVLRIGEVFAYFPNSTGYHGVP
jgi:hypothetical protein